MADDVTLRECLACHSMNAVIDKLSAQPLACVRCGACGLRTRWDSREIVIALWNTRVPDPAFTAAQVRIAALEAEVARLEEERRAWVQADTDNIRASLPRENP